jgi:hypothetical protein
MINQLKPPISRPRIAENGYYIRYVSLPVRTEQLDSHWTDFHEIWYLRIFRKFVEKI